MESIESKFTLTWNSSYRQMAGGPLWAGMPVSVRQNPISTIPDPTIEEWTAQPEECDENARDESVIS